MSKKYVRVSNLIKKFSFFFIIGIISIIFIFNQELAIWITIIFIILFSLFYFPSLSFKNKVARLMKQHYILNDDNIAQKLMRPLQEVRKKLFILSKDQKKKKWLIIFLNKRYILYNEQTIEKFKELYFKGYSEKEILENLKKQINIKTRAEIKAIENTLINQNRLRNRDISVK